MTERPTYDASGFSSLPGDSAVTAAPAHPLADLPFSVVHSDGDSEGEGLSGQPAFSSVLTVMAGTVKNPESLDQSITSPTITRDESDTTQWPSHSSSQGSKISFSSSSAGDMIPPASSGLTSSMSHQHNTPPQAVTITSTISGPLSVSFMDGDRTVSLSTVPPSMLSSSMSSSAPFTSPLLSSVLPLFSPSSSAGRTNKAALSHGQSIVSSLDPQILSPAGYLGSTDILTTTHSTTHSYVELPPVTERLQSTTPKPAHVLSENSLEKGNEVTKHSSLDKLFGVSGAYIRSASTEVIQISATSKYNSYSTPNHIGSLLKILYKTTQSQIPGVNSVTANTIEISSSFPSNQESQAVQRQQGALQNPTSTLLSVHPKGYSVSSHVTQQMLTQTAYAEKEKKIAIHSQTFIHRSVRDTTMSPLSSNVVNLTVSPAMTVRPSETPAGITSLPETAITEPTPTHSGMVSSEHATNPGDLLMAVGHGSFRVPTININYNRGDITAADLKSTSNQNHQSNSLSPLDSTSVSILSSITSTGTTSSTSESDLLHLPANEAINVGEFVAQTGSSKGITQEPRGWIIPETIYYSDSKTSSLSGSALPVSVAKDMTYKTTYESLSHATQPPNVLPSFLVDNTGLSATSEVIYSDQPKTLPQRTTSQSTFETISLPTFYTTSGPTPPPTKSHQTAEISAHIIQSDGAGRSVSLPLKVKTPAGRNENAPASDVQTTHGYKPFESFVRIEFSSFPSLLSGNEESTVKRDTVSSGQFTPQFPSFITTKDLLKMNKGSEGSGKGSPTEIPFSPVTSDATPLKSTSNKDDVTLTRSFKHSSLSPWSEITMTPRKNTASLSQRPITSLINDQSSFFLGRQRTIPSNDIFAATTSSSDRHNSSESLSAIFSFGTKLMASYTKWKTTKPVSFQSPAAFEQNTSIGFDMGNSNLPADGPSYEHQKLEDGQEVYVQLLNSTDPTVVTSDLNALFPTVGEHPSFTHVKGTSEYEKQKLNLSPANLRSAVSVTVQQGATVNTAWGTVGFLPFSQNTTDSVTSSKASSLALVSKHSPPPENVDSLEYAFDDAVTLSTNPALDFTETDKINNITDLKLRGLTSPTELGPLSSSLHSSSSSSSVTSPLSYSSFTSQSSSLHSKPPTSVSSSTSLSTSHSAGKILSIITTMPPSTASSSMSVKATFPSSSPSLTIVPGRSEEVTETFVVLTEPGTDDSSREVAPTFPKEKAASLAPSQSDRITTERTSQVSPLPHPQDTPTDSFPPTTTTVASATKTKNPITTMPSVSVSPRTTQSATPQPVPVTRRTTTTTTRTTTRTLTTRRTFTPLVPRTSPPRVATTIFISPFTTTTEAPPQQCNITERLWVKTGKQSFCHKRI